MLFFVAHSRVFCTLVLSLGEGGIAALCNDGVLAVTSTIETINADTFNDFVRGELLPRMNPFDGSSSKSIAVMDNCAVHHVPIVEDLFCTSRCSLAVATAL